MKKNNNQKAIMTRAELRNKLENDGWMFVKREELDLSDFGVTDKVINDIYISKDEFYGIDLDKSIDIKDFLKVFTHTMGTTVHLREVGDSYNGIRVRETIIKGFCSESKPIEIA